MKHRSRQFIFTTFLLHLGLVSVTPSLRAEMDGPDCYRVLDLENNHPLALRIRPNRHAAKVAEVPSHFDELVNLRKCDPDITEQTYREKSKKEIAQLLAKPRWCKVRYQGVSGWTLNKYLKESKKSGKECKNRSTPGYSE